MSWESIIIGLQTDFTGNYLMKCTVGLVFTG